MRILSLPAAATVALASFALSGCTSREGLLSGDAAAVSPDGSGADDGSFSGSDATGYDATFTGTDVDDASSVGHAPGADGGDAAVEAGPILPPWAASCADAGVPNVSTTGEGCADGTREGLSVSDVAACAGTWSSTVDMAGPTLCSPGWHVCLGNEAAFSSTAQFDFKTETAFCGCFALDAAQEPGSQADPSCRPGCTAAFADAGLDAAATIGLQMGGIGASCPWLSKEWMYGAGIGCLAGGQTYGPIVGSTGCYDGPLMQGVVCCRNGT